MLGFLTVAKDMTFDAIAHSGEYEPYVSDIAPSYLSMARPAFFHKPSLSIAKRAKQEEEMHDAMDSAPMVAHNGAGRPPRTVTTEADRIQSLNPGLERHRAVQEAWRIVQKREAAR